MKQISLTLYKLGKVIEFEKYIDGYLAQLRFTLSHNSLLAVLTFCNIFHIFNCHTIKILTINVVDYLKSTIENDSLDLYCELLTVLHEFYVLSSSESLVIISNLIHIDIPNNLLEIFTTIYPSSFNHLYLSIIFEKGLNETLLDDKNFNDKVIRIFESSPPSHSFRTFSLISFSICENSKYVIRLFLKNFLVL
ncbi:hypothetical protein MXB_914 [Myxobolus squamalis]|nr:hypothetical protein MXB_914 [Myxobolus squamalis]